MLPEEWLLTNNMLPEAVQLSEGTGANQFATALQEPDAADKLIFEGQTKVGDSLSVTVTVIEQVEVLLFTSVTVQTTVVVPTG